jgi:HSP20 family molecular chaperone IbpA
MYKNVFDWFNNVSLDVFSQKSNRFNFEHESSLNEDGSLSIFIEIPGIKESNLKISIFENEIAIEGKRETKFSNKIVSHSLSIPIGFSSENIKAELIDGVLTLTLQKNNEVKSVKIIKINK